MPSQTSGLLWLLVGEDRWMVGDSRYGELEGVDGVAVFLHQRPADRLVELLNRLLRLLGDVSQDRVHHLALVESLFTLDDILG